MGKRISICGAGYVGSVSAGCLAKLGHTVILVDIDKVKVDIINSGRSHIVEPGLNELLAEGVGGKKICATQSIDDAIWNTDVTFICVGTPSTKHGGLNLDHVFSVANEIGKSLKNKQSFHLIAIRSTVLPGTVHNCIDIIQKISGKIPGVDFGFCSNPEFLREGVAINDYFNPPYTLIGTEDSTSLKIMKEIYQDINAPIYDTGIKNAEILKYINNSFHALKVAFGNEVGNIAKSFGIDSHKMMDIFFKDTKLNISSYYLKPGFAFGGSCLPKDLKALVYHAKANHIEVPILSHVMQSNEEHIKTGLEMVLGTNKKRIGIVGLSFKSGTDDLRESPMVIMIEQLLGKGRKVKIFDRNVSLAKIHGSNKAYLETHIPHISELIDDSNDFDTFLNSVDVIVVANKEKELVGRLLDLVSKQQKTVIDLVRIHGSLVSNENYMGICW